MEEIIRLINAYWKFDNDQQHLSTWHDKQDLLEAIRQVKTCNKPAVSTRFMCHSCGTYHSGDNSDQLHEICRDCFLHI